MSVGECVCVCVCVCVCLEPEHSQLSPLREKREPRLLPKSSGETGGRGLRAEVGGMCFFLCGLFLFPLFHSYRSLFSAPDSLPYVLSLFHS